MTNKSRAAGVFLADSNTPGTPGSAHLSKEQALSETANQPKGDVGYLGLGMFPSHQRRIPLGSPAGLFVEVFRMLYFWSISVALGIIFGGPCGKPWVSDPVPPHSEQGQVVK